MKSMFKHIMFSFIIIFPCDLLTEDNKTALPRAKSPTTFDMLKSFVVNIPSHIKDAGTYLSSYKGVKDVVGAFCLGIALTALHELGHAVAAKLLYGCPINIMLGTHSRHITPYASVAGIQLGGLDPTIGFSKYFCNAEQYHPLKHAAISAAGPIAGALSSFVAYTYLKKYNKLYITKAAALYCLINHTIGIAGLSGIFFAKSDSAKVVEHIKEYLNQ